jgi:hypothetical protein
MFYVCVDKRLHAACFAILTICQLFEIKRLDIYALLYMFASLSHACMFARTSMRACSHMHASMHVNNLCSHAGACTATYLRCAMPATLMIARHHKIQVVMFVVYASLLAHPCEHARTCMRACM